MAKDTNLRFIFVILVWIIPEFKEIGSEMAQTHLMITTASADLNSQTYEVSSTVQVTEQIIYNKSESFLTPSGNTGDNSVEGNTQYQTAHPHGEKHVTVSNVNHSETHTPLRTIYTTGKSARKTAATIAAHRKLDKERQRLVEETLNIPTTKRNKNGWPDVPAPDWTNIRLAVIVVCLGIPLLTFLVLILCRIRIVLTKKYRYYKMQKSGNLGLSTISLANSRTQLDIQPSPTRHFEDSNNLAPPSRLSPSSSLCYVNNIEVEDCVIDVPSDGNGVVKETTTNLD